MSDPRAVKRALRALAVGSGRDPATDADCIDRAADAVGDVEAAAAFLDRYGVTSLRRGIRRAGRTGDRERARRGQRALAAIEWFRAVA